MIVTPISEKDFFNAKRTAIPNYLIIDKKIKKRENIITIGGKKFIDGLGEGNQPNIYTYMGDYQKLNASLFEFMCSACEEYSYELIDKRTGKEIATFTNVPVFSKDYKYVMDLGQLFSNNPTILSCYKWKETLTPSTGTYKEYANWSPVATGFWGNDSYFYTAVVPTITIDNQNAEEKLRTATRYNFRYIRIQIKRPTPKQEEGNGN